MTIWAPRYRTFYEALTEDLPTPPLVKMPQGTFVLRSVAAEYQGKPADPAGARTIRHGSIADHRWTGARDYGKPGRGALYVSMHLDSLMNETLNYSNAPLSMFTRRTHTTYALRATTTFRYQLEKTLWLFELSLEMPEGRDFFQVLGAKKAVNKALAQAGFPTIERAYQSSDYSFCRALSHAIWDEYRGLSDGMSVSTAHDHYPTIGETANNLALYGEDNEPLPTLRAASQTTYDMDSSGRLKQDTKYL